MNTRIFDNRLLTRTRQRRIVNKAFARCDFNFNRLRPGLDHFGGGRVLIKPASGWLGSYVPHKRIVKIWFGRGGQAVQGAFLHELGHAADLLCLTTANRDALFAAMHDGETPGAHNNLPESWAVNRSCPSGHGHWWFDSTYKEGVGEAFAEVFLAAFTDIPPATSYAHQVTPEAIGLLRDIFAHETTEQQQRGDG